MPHPHLSRRALVASGLAFTSAAIVAPKARAAEVGSLVVWKDRSCGCCAAWIEHVRAAGFTATAVDTDDLAAIKTRLGVPAKLAACHTAQIGGYLVEGHVPASAVLRLLVEKPLALGIAVPGMPIGSPGMESPALKPERYDVVLFGQGLERAFMRFEGAREL